MVVRDIVEFFEFNVWLSRDGKNLVRFVFFIDLIYNSLYFFFLYDFILVLI